ncbi:carbohydrate ABC transporter permease [Jiangella alba]|uniref:Carbohydrate ABC transporter membrane protein 2, CUT1 family n=1 Tax=Jiangella alba TaxID=561176 RepID=A0A1H5PYH6_9ACTN|nr:carbohydrate ABC transporter permease [Jiangella alba]SEF18910.1 carbohydrate ABC transporter membrane protein 2, CUT1 family [Jiangella alba]
MPELVTAHANRRDGRNGFAHLVLVIGSLVMLFPFAWQIVSSLSTNAEVTAIPLKLWPSSLHFENYTEVFEQLSFASQLGVSVTVTVIRVFGHLLLGALAGYAFARMRFPGRGLMFALVLAIMMVPPQVFLISQYQIVQGLGWLNTVAGIVAPGIFTAFSAFLMRQFFLGLPDELEEAARLDGANPFQVFWKVMLPLARPGLSALAVVGVLVSWNELLWPLVVATEPGTQPLSVGLATLQGQFITDYPVLMAAALLACAPILIVFLAMQRRVIDGLAVSGMK